MVPDLVTHFDNLSFNDPISKQPCPRFPNNRLEGDIQQGRFRPHYLFNFANLLPDHQSLIDFSPQRCQVASGRGKRNLV